MKISVIIPCYNAAAYLHKCIDSVLAQTIGKDSLEIICIDDHSKDNTREILQEYEHRYPAIFIIILLDENRKQGYARNVGLEYASGEYITFVDADDWISPVMLKTMCELADQHPYREKSANDRTCILGGYDVIEAGSCKVSSETEETDWKSCNEVRELRHFFYSAESAHPVRTMASCAEQKRKVVEVLIAVAEKGGVENTIKIMLRELESSQLHFRIVQMVWEGYRWLDEKIEFHPLLEGRHGHSLQEFADTYAAFEKDVKEPPDLIIAVGWPYLCTVARMAVNCCGWKTKVISWLHSDIERYDAAGYGGREALQDADGHLAISMALQKSLEEISPADRVYRVKNPVDLPQMGLGTEMCQMESLHRELIYVGRISKEKNIGFLLQCIQALPTWKLDIVGDGQEQKKLREIAVAIGVENRVHWLGWQEDPWQYAAEKDALILSSYYEGFPLTAIEAMSRGLPVISTAVGGMQELVEEGVTGWLYDAGQMRTLLDVLHRMEELGCTGLNRAACVRKAAEYDSRRVMAQMKDILLRLMS